MIVDRTDFVAVPVRDIERSKRFYGETLGLSPVGDGGGWPEFQLGENVSLSLYLIDPTNISQTFQGAAHGPHRPASRRQPADAAPEVRAR